MLVTRMSANIAQNINSPCLRLVVRKYQRHSAVKSLDRCKYHRPSRYQTQESRQGGGVSRIRVGIFLGFQPDLKTCQPPIQRWASLGS